MAERPTPPRAAATGDAHRTRRFRLLHALAADPDHSQRSLARALGVSLGAANAALNALVAEGLVTTRATRGARGRLCYGYALTPTGEETRRALAPDHLARRRAAFDALRREIEALEAEIGDNGAGRDGDDRAGRGG